MKQTLILLLALVSFSMAEQFPWKTFDVKVGAYFGERDYYGGMVAGANLEIVKPFNSYVGAGFIFDVGSSLGRDYYLYDNYDERDDYLEFSDGLILNFNAPIFQYFSLTGNFMALISFKKITSYHGDQDDRVWGHDPEGNYTYVVVDRYKYPEVENYDSESFAFKSNFGVKFHGKNHRFGVEIYPVEYQIERFDLRYSVSINAVMRLF